MTFNFFDWNQAFPVYPAIRGASRRRRLVARWRHGADGRLECRWQPEPVNPRPG